MPFACMASSFYILPPPSLEDLWSAMDAGDMLDPALFTAKVQTAVSHIAFYIS
jgi:hypothetical protein